MLHVDKTLYIVYTYEFCSVRFLCSSFCCSISVHSTVMAGVNLIDNVEYRNDSIVLTFEHGQKQEHFACH